ncbi:MAG TPA: lysylphosphatidylglycerol synthase transmembrane domain-containing protein [Candidatus Micrarchaeia archaeon]|nr:lysylphosphatidylglycerol synthase transmembrane domain-containing protein [Candidatus Micrarchaeia archaeon]
MPAVRWRVLLGRRWVRVLVATVVAAVLLVLVLHRVSLVDVLHDVRQASPPLVAAAALLAFGSVSMRAWRYRLLLGRGGALPVTAVSVAAWGAGQVLPGPGGDAAFVWLARRDLGVPVLRAAGAALVARLLDLASLIVILLVSAEAAGLAVPGALRAVVAALGAAFALTLLGLFHPRPRRLLLGFVERLPVVGRFAVRGEAVLQELSSPGALLALAGATVGARVFSAVEYWCLFAALGAHLGFWQVWFALAVRTLLFSLPIQGVGGLGTSQLWWTGGLTLAGWSLPAALALSLEVQLLDLAIALPEGLAGFAVVQARRVLRRRAGELGPDPADGPAAPAAAPSRPPPRVLAAVRTGARAAGRVGGSARARLGPRRALAREGVGRALGRLVPSGTGRWIGIPVACYLVLRLPSLFEPHWYTDEAGYATTAWLAGHGLSLYGTVWNNKPPLLFWTYGLALRWFGTGELGIHLLSMATGLAALLACWKLVLDGWGLRRAAVVAGVAAFLLGSPLLNGDLALPENFLVAPAAWGMVATLLALRSTSARRQLLRGVLAGGLFAVAILYQQTAVADFGAACLWLLVLPGGRGRRQLLATFATTTVVVVAAVAPYVVVAGAGNVAFLLVTSFLTYTQHSLPISAATLLPRIAEGAALLVGAVGARRGDPRRHLVWIWAAAVLIVETLANRPYVFFSLPMVVPLLTLFAGTTLPRRAELAPLLRRARSVPRSILVGRAPLAAAVMIPLALWGGILHAHTKFLYTVPLAGVYYQNFIGHLAGAVSPVAYADTFDLRAYGEGQAAGWLRANHLTNRSAVVWSSDAWDYVLANLRPVLPTPAIYVDEAWLGSAAVTERVDHAHPTVVVTTADTLSARPQIRRLLAHGYVRTFASGEVAVWVQRAALARPVPAAARRRLAVLPAVPLGAVGAVPR